MGPLRCQHSSLTRPSAQSCVHAFIHPPFRTHSFIHPSTHSAATTCRPALLWLLTRVFMWPGVAAWPGVLMGLENFEMMVRKAFLEEVASGLSGTPDRGQ